MNDVFKLPIVIIGTAARCGSTPYTFLLHQKTQLPFFLEPWGKKMMESSNESLMIKKAFIEYINFKSNSNRYIVKFFFNDIEHRSPYHDDLSTGYKIGLFRKNIVDQVASYYIAEGRKKYRDIKGEEQKKYIINIDHKLISTIIRIITRANFYLENCNFLDKKIYYEDIDFSSLESKYEKTFQPLNIEELKTTIKNVMNEKIPFDWKNPYSYSENIKITYV